MAKNTRGPHNAFDITGLKPYTDYVNGIETEDNPSQKSSKALKSITTKEAGIFFKKSVRD